MISKEVKESLSKYKYIYKIYYRDNTYHIEKFPIIYMNDSYIYIKENSKRLKEIILNSYYNKVFDNIEKAIENVSKYEYSNCNIYYIDTDELEINIKELKVQWSKEKKKRDFKDKRYKVTRLKEEYKKELKELKIMEDKMR